jgi:hypothetical protein
MEKSVNSSELQNTHMLESTRGTKLDPPSESATVLPNKNQGEGGRVILAKKHEKPC